MLKSLADIMKVIVNSFYDIKVVTKKRNEDVSSSFLTKLICGTDGGTRTHMVSRWILNPVRLPFRHIGEITLLY